MILRAETSQYPQIEELLATIDQPKPIDSFMRTYPLKNLNATEVEEILREMLGVGKEGGRSKGGAARTPGAPGSPGPSSGPSDQLPQTILQETVTGASQLGVDPADIKLFSSEVSFTQEMLLWEDGVARKLDIRGGELEGGGSEPFLSDSPLAATGSDR